MPYFVRATRRFVTPGCALILLLSVPAHAQERPEPVQVEKLPISLERIQRKLAQTPRAPAAGLKLEYHVDVYGKAPPLDLFDGFDLQNGPIQYGGPTHNEILWVVTPEEFRSPPADFGALVKWLTQQLGKKSTR